MRRTTRRLLVVAGSLFGGAIALTLLLVLINLPWFDEPLSPELVLLRTPQAASMDDNSYPVALGFLAADERDPRSAGEAIVQALRERFERRQRLTLTPSEMAAILGDADQQESWRAEFNSLDCNARRYLDCADRLIAQVAQVDVERQRLAVLLDRYDTLLRHEHFVENQELEVSSPVAPYHAILDVGRLRLALSYRRDTIQEFLEKAADDFAFWRTMLREGQTLGAKMVSLAGVQNTLDFLSTLMRNRELEDADLQLIHGFLRPFTREESDIGEAFLSETRIGLLSEIPPVAMSSSWATRLVLQENATLNEGYRVTIVPIRLRAALSAEEFHDREGFKPLQYELRALPNALYNLGGNLAQSRSTWDPQEFISRVHDENGRISLVLLQAEGKQSRAPDFEAVLRSSAHRNPYTNEPMKYDAQAHTIWFKCLHAAFHPPDPPDVCSVAIAR